ncbi:MAG TPA: hypothetical protein VLG47_00425 [Candidatus Saccharimonadales bacterium]|nr:hypothetical protein [Candidatus Saccharimonadales bacterium]
MAERQASPLNRLYAWAMYDQLSAICMKYAGVARIVVGDNPTRWYATDTSLAVLSELTDRTATKGVLLQKDRSLGRNPAKSTLRRATVFYTDTGALREQQQQLERPTLRAVAFTVGKVIVAGEIQAAGLKEDYVSVALRQDRHDRMVAIGLLDPDTRQFTPAEVGTLCLNEFVPVREFAAGRQYPDVPLQ